MCVQIKRGGGKEVGGVVREGGKNQYCTPNALLQKMRKTKSILYEFYKTFHER